MRTTISIMTALALVSAVNAQEKKPGPGPGIPEAQQLMERARQAKEAGRMDEARELAEKARQIGEMHHDKKPGKPGFDKERAEHFEKARHQIEELQRAGKHEEAEQLKRRLAGAMTGKYDGPHDNAPGKPGEGPAKIRHLMEAIRNLREAGMNEPAESLEKVLHKMKEDFERRQKEGGEHAREGEKNGPGRDMKKPPHPPGDEIHALREQVERLTHAVEELRAQVNRRGGEGGGHKEHEDVRRPGN